MMSAWFYLINCIFLGDRKKDHFFMHWFTYQMSTGAPGGQGLSQESGTPSRLLTWIIGT